MAMSLAKELKSLECELAAEDFRELLGDLHHSLAPSFSEEQILCREDARQKFVRAVQQKAGKSLPEEMILRHLLNLRKRIRRRHKRPKPAKRARTPKERS